MSHATAVVELALLSRIKITASSTSDLNNSTVVCWGVVALELSVPTSLKMT